MPKIVIGSPCKNRGWILPEYLKALEDIEYHNKEYLFYENHSTDDTAVILRNHKSEYPCNIFGAWIGPNIGSDRHEYGQDNYAHLAKIRNRFLELFLNTKGDYLLSIDSDIIVPTDIINQLLPYAADRKTIIGAAICNIPNKQIDGKTPCNFMQKHGNVFVHPMGYVPKGLFNADLVGACYLIPRKAIEDGIKYAPDCQGEDAPFCMQAKEKGYKLLINMDCRPNHRMVKPPI